MGMGSLVSVLVDPVEYDVLVGAVASWVCRDPVQRLESESWSMASSQGKSRPGIDIELMSVAGMLGYMQDMFFLSQRRHRGSSLPHFRLDFTHSLHAVRRDGSGRWSFIVQVWDLGLGRFP